MEQIAERRYEPHLTINEEVYDQKSGKTLGRTIDLNAYGMMMLSKKQFSEDEEIRISLDIPKGKKDGIRASLLAQCRWCEPVPGMSCYSAKVDLNLFIRLSVKSTILQPYFPA